MFYFTTERPGWYNQKAIGRLKMMECPFCNSTLENERIIEETRYCRVLFSSPRLVKGHLLIVPKKHVEKLSQLSAAERQNLLNTAIKYQEKIIAHFAPGCDIRQNFRPFQKQDGVKVDHLHIHLLPREFKDGLYQKCQKYETDIFQKLSSGEIKVIKKLLQS